MWNYDLDANTDNNSCIPFISGCMNSDYVEYNSDANLDDGSCFEIIILGCMDQSASNFNPEANSDNGSCIPFLMGCTNPLASNYNPFANLDDGSCTEVSCPPINFGGWQWSTASTILFFLDAAEDLSVLGNIEIGAFFLDQNNQEACGGSTTFSSIQDTYQLTFTSDSPESSNQTGFNIGDEIILKAENEFGQQFYIVPTIINNGALDPIDFVFSHSFNEFFILEIEIFPVTCENGTYIQGCMEINSINYDPVATVNDGSCIPIINGCMDASMFNYNIQANTDDGSCIEVINGCIDSTAYN